MNKLINKIITLINNKKYDEIIIKLYESKELIINIIDTYILTLDSNNYNKINLETNFSDDDIISSYNKYTSSKKSTDKSIYLELIIIRKIIYELMTINTHLTLLEQTEINNSKTNIKYNVVVGDTENKQQLFILYLIIYYLESIIRHKTLTKYSHSYVGIDYEFAMRKIALMQINFETMPSLENKTNSYIWIINPGEFIEERVQFLVQYLMRNKYITKILHGADSLDIPYMFHEMFNDDFNTISDFAKGIIDTRFLCEFYKVSMNYDKKCSIYEALLSFETITQEKYDYLVDTHDKMGPVQDISWNIHKMSSFHILYGLYDVLFLKHFVNDIYKKAKADIPDQFNAYTYLPLITKLVYLDKHDIIDISKQIKNEIDSVNNYFIRKNNNILTLIKIYNYVIDNMILHELGIDFSHLLGVNYYRSTIILLLKLIVYSIVTNNFTVFKKKKDISKQKINIEIFYKKLNELGLKKLVYMLKVFQNNAKQKILLL